MKKLLYTICLGVILGGAYGCKKGENDPFLSLRSRKARLVGEWTVSQASSSSSNTSSGITTTSTSTYDGTTMTETYTAPGMEMESSMNMSHDITFEKDGTYKMVTTITDGGDTYIESSEGNWAFIGKSKSADLKNKEAISLFQTKYTDADGYSENLSGTFWNYESMIITQLKNKEIVFSYDESGSSSGSGGFDQTWTSKGTTTLTKK